AWSTPAVATATLANVPATADSTWTAVNFTSITVTWQDGGNPSGTTYQIQLSTTNSFNGSSDQTLQTAVLSQAFSNLDPATTYYAQVEAINYSGIPTGYLNLGS